MLWWNELVLVLKWTCINKSNPQWNAYFLSKVIFLCSFKIKTQYSTMAQCFLSNGRLSRFITTYSYSYLYSLLCLQPNLFTMYLASIFFKQEALRQNELHSCFAFIPAVILKADATFFRRYLTHLRLKAFHLSFPCWFPLSHYINWTILNTM